jgi:antitoxin component of MazEF toxin-antitoxin module
MAARVQRWGNSYGLRLAKHVLERARISVGDDVEVIAGEEEILIRKVLIRKVSRPKFNLAEMVSRMPRRYRAREESFGKLVGKEEVG